MLDTDRGSWLLSQASYGHPPPTLGGPVIITACRLRSRCQPVNVTEVKGQVKHLFCHGDNPADTQFSNVDEVWEASSVAWRVVIHADVKWWVICPHQFIYLTSLLRSQSDRLRHEVIHLHRHHLFLHLTHQPATNNQHTSIHCGRMNTTTTTTTTTAVWRSFVLVKLVVWHSGRTSVCDRRTFPVLRLTCSWWVTTYVGKPSTTRPAN